MIITLTKDGHTLLVDILDDAELLYARSGDPEMSVLAGQLLAKIRRQPVTAERTSR